MPDLTPRQQQALALQASINVINDTRDALRDSLEGLLNSMEKLEADLEQLEGEMKAAGEPLPDYPKR